MNQEPSVTLSQDIAAFLADLRRHDMAPKTVQAYTADMVGFARWFVDTTGEPFSARALTATDLLDFKAHQGCDPLYPQ